MGKFLVGSQFIKHDVLNPDVFIIIILERHLVKQAFRSVYE